jgi:hypothetical protein
LTMGISIRCRYELKAPGLRVAYLFSLRSWFPPSPTPSLGSLLGGEL